MPTLGNQIALRLHLIIIFHIKHPRFCKHCTFTKNTLKKEMFLKEHFFFLLPNLLSLCPNQNKRKQALCSCPFDKSCRKSGLYISKVDLYDQIAYYLHQSIKLKQGIYHRFNTENILPQEKIKVVQRNYRLKNASVATM